MLFRRSLALFAAALTLPLAAQTAAHTPAKSATRPVAAALKPYAGCTLPGGPDLLQTTTLPEAPMTRAAQTLTGPKKIRLVDGVFTAYGFAQGVPFANVKVEQLPAATYTAEKADLISEFDKINATGEDTERNYALKPTLNGFEIYGFDRKGLDGNVLGIYLLFDNPHHMATTAYFLNAPVGQRRFGNLTEYTGLREGFLNAYTVCVRKALGGAAAAPAKTAKTTAKPAPRHAAKPAAKRSHHS